MPSPWLKRRKPDVAAEFAKREPWITRFTVAKQQYGGAIAFDDDLRVLQFCQAFPDAHSILELGSLEGGMTFAIARRLPRAQIVGVEGRQANVEKAEFVQRLLGIDNVRFLQGNLEGMDLSALGRFDAVLCSGLLYHLPRPWELLSQFRPVTSCLLLSTHYAAADRIETEVEGFQGHWYNEFGAADPLSGLSPRSFWMTLPAIVACLETEGFSVRVLSDQAHVHGPLVSVLASAT